MFRPLFIIIVLFIIASFILQMISLLANFNALRSVYIARIDLDVPSGGDGSIFDNIWNNAKDTILGNTLPNYFTLALFVICEGKSSNQTVCSPPSFGFNYRKLPPFCLFEIDTLMLFHIESTGALQTLEGNIPSYAHSMISKIQQGVFIPSVVLCFLLLCYSFFYLCNDGICNFIIIETLSILAFLFCLATFVIQYVAYDKIRDGINDLKSNLLGGLINDVVTVTPHSGKSIWLSLAAFILLFFVSVLLLFSFCTRRKGGKHRTRRNQPESYEMT